MNGAIKYLTSSVLLMLSGCQQSFDEGQVTQLEEDNQQKYQQAMKREQTIAKNNVWHAAKFRGVSFRAIGQEPAWLLEVYPNEKILLHRNYGDKIDEFIYQTPKVEQEKRRSIFSLDQQGTVTIEGTPCSDVMSGEKFETTVTIMLEDQMLKGCGRALY